MNSYNIVKWEMVVLIILLIFPHLQYSKIPGTSTDEFGYIYHSINMLGWDWKALYEYYPFYGAGISLLWIPMFKILSYLPTTTMYQAIVVLNAVLLSLSFLVSLKCAEKLFNKWNNWARLFSCFVLSFYPSNYFYARLALSETLLYLMFWILLCLLIKFLETKKTYWMFLLGITSSYMVLVHLRTTGIVVILGVFIVYISLKNENRFLNILSFFIPIVVGVILLLMIQNNYYENLGGINEANIQNTQINVGNLFLNIIINIKSALLGGTGHIFYYLISGGICGFCGIVYLLKKCITYIKKIRMKQKEDIYDLVSIFLLFTFVLNFIAFYIRPHEYISRYDVALYGRYMENIMGPILLYGLYYLETKRKCLEHLYIFLLVCCTPILIRILENSGEAIFSADSAPAVGGFFLFDMTNQSIDFSVLKILCVGIIFSIFCWGICQFWLKYKEKRNFNKIIMSSIIMLMAVYWGYLGIQSENVFTGKRMELYYEYNSIKKEIDKLSPSNIIFVQNEPNSRNNVKYLQFLLGEESIKVEKLNYLESIGDEELVLCEKKDVLNILIEKGFNKKEYSKLDLYYK